MRALRYYYGKGKEGRGWEGGEGRAGQERNLRGKISVYGRNPFNLIFSVFSVINLLLNFKCVIVIYNFSITNFVTEICTVGPILFLSLVLMSKSSHCRRPRPPKKVVHCLLLLRQTLSAVSQAFSGSRVARAGVSEFLSISCRPDLECITDSPGPGDLFWTQVPLFQTSSTVAFDVPNTLASSLLLVVTNEVVTLRYFPQFETLSCSTKFIYCVAGSPSAITGSTNRARPSAQQQQPPVGTAFTCITTPVTDSTFFAPCVSEFLSPEAWLGLHYGLAREPFYKVRP